MQVRLLPMSNKEKVKQPDPDLPQLHFFAVVAGPRGSGKSVLVRNLILRKDMLKPFFPNDSIFIFSRSLDVNDDYAEVKTRYKFHDYSNELVLTIMKAQENCIKAYGKSRTRSILFVMDDILDSGAFNYLSMVETIAIRGRHLKLSCILVTQSYMRVSRTIRINQDYLIFFSPHNLSEISRILDENIEKKYRDMYETAIKKIFNSKKHSFILIDYKTSDPKRRWRVGLSDLLVDYLPSSEDVF